MLKAKEYLRRKDQIDAIDKIEDQKEKERIISTLNAIEMYVMCSCNCK